MCIPKLEVFQELDAKLTEPSGIHITIGDQLDTVLFHLSNNTQSVIIYGFWRRSQNTCSSIWNKLNAYILLSILEY